MTPAQAVHSLMSEPVEWQGENITRGELWTHLREMGLAVDLVDSVVIGLPSHAAGSDAPQTPTARGDAPR